MNQPTAEEALGKLERLVGEWTLEARWPGGEPWPGGGRVTFEWHDSQAHLIERTTIELPEANGSQLRELGALYDNGQLRPVIDRTFAFDLTLEAMAYVEQGHTKAGKVVVSVPPITG